MKKGSPKSRRDQINKHSTPTEPLPDMHLVLPAPESITPEPLERTMAVPFPPGTVPYGSQPPNYTQTQPAYPQHQPAYPPDVPFENQRYGRVPGGAYYPGPTAYADNPWGAGKVARPQPRRRSLLPSFIGLLFVLLQLLLVVRFIVRLVNLAPDQQWSGLVVSVSELFVIPFRQLWLQIPSVNSVVAPNFEIYTLIAILIYGIISRLIVRILKFIVNSR